MVDRTIELANETRNETAVTRDDEEKVQEEEVHQENIFNFNGHDELYEYDDDDPAYMLNSEHFEMRDEFVGMWEARNCGSRWEELRGMHCV